MTIEDFVQLIADELGVEVADIVIQMKEGEIKMLIKNVDEDVFDEDEDFEDGDDDK